jgi:hypothetical protein
MRSPRSVESKGNSSNRKHKKEKQEPRSEYYWVTDGEWIQVPKRGYKEQCCACALVHRHNYRIDDKGKIWIQSTTDNRATAAARRGFKFEKDD